MRISTKDEEASRIARRGFFVASCFEENIGRKRDTSFTKKYISSEIIHFFNLPPREDRE